MDALPKMTCRWAMGRREDIIISYEGHTKQNHHTYPCTCENGYFQKTRSKCQWEWGEIVHCEDVIWRGLYKNQLGEEARKHKNRNFTLSSNPTLGYQVKILIWRHMYHIHYSINHRNLDLETKNLERNKEMSWVYLMPLNTLRIERNPDSCSTGVGLENAVISERSQMVKDRHSLTSLIHAESM